MINKVPALVRFEDGLFYWLYKRWRKRATLDQIENHRSWLAVDVAVKRNEFRRTS